MILSRKSNRGLHRLVNIPWWAWLVIFITIGSIDDFSKYVLPLLIFSGVGYVVYRISKRQTKLSHSETEKRIQDLKNKIQLADNQVKLLKNYKVEHKTKQYALLAEKVLPQINEIKSDAKQLKGHLETPTYNRITKKATDFQSEIINQLELLGADALNNPLTEQEELVFSIAPELIESFQNIQQDHKTILTKIDESDLPNKAELKALHQSEMNHFSDILKGYLEIKQSPKDYYQASERLNAAKNAITQFDVNLDETLRELNERGLKDFEISLRMMTANHPKEDNPQNNE
ncbi:hypothetical protein HMPREF9318_01710 [Streptococcus urinalis FB127-CNA-2]|uniref:hypothetical protein n=1 Tax=Streptococcus urinalis TaxID=149016 RepID=UPI00029949A6|nr:hypothetical protein HMPREF9318_01710 [Streptococcus urinalis FB127-CNA-2]VEF32914.1 membrane protein [Streptococcus urinalis]